MAASATLRYISDKSTYTVLYLVNYDSVEWYFSLKIPEICPYILHPLQVSTEFPDTFILPCAISLSIGNRV